jgi:hypothetical protein
MVREHNWRSKPHECKHSYIMQTATHLELHIYYCCYHDDAFSTVCSDIPNCTDHRLLRVFYVLVYFDKSSLENTKCQAENSLEPVTIIFICPNSISQLVANQFKHDKCI